MCVVPEGGVAFFRIAEDVVIDFRRGTLTSECDLINWEE